MLASRASTPWIAGSPSPVRRRAGVVPPPVPPGRSVSVPGVGRVRAPSGPSVPERRPDPCRADGAVRRWMRPPPGPGVGSPPAAPCSRGPASRSPRGCRKRRSAEPRVRPRVLCGVRTTPRMASVRQPAARASARIAIRPARVATSGPAATRPGAASPRAAAANPAARRRFDQPRDPPTRRVLRHQQCGNTPVMVRLNNSAVDGYCVAGIGHSGWLAQRLSEGVTHADVS